MYKKTSLILAFIMFVLPFAFTINALACDDSIISREDTFAQVEALDSSLIPPITAYLQRQYNNTTNMSDKMGYLFALKAIAYYGTAYTTMDCSKLVATAIYDAYQEYGYGNYSPFLNQRTSRNQYSYCSSRNFTFEITTDDKTEGGGKKNGLDKNEDLKTGDLIFWESSSSTVNHVAIFIRYNNKAYFIESLGSQHGVAVTEPWQNTDYKYKKAARLCHTYKVTFKTGEPFNENLGIKTVFYNFPPELPTLPAHSGYVIGSWTPSITEGVTANTVYTGNYVMRADSVTIPK